MSEGLRASLTPRAAAHAGLGVHARARRRHDRAHDLLAADVPEACRHVSVRAEPTTWRSSGPGRRARPPPTGSRPPARASCSSTRRRSRATSPAAAASPGARRGCCRSRSSRSWRTSSTGWSAASATGSASRASARGPLAYMTQRRRLDHFLLQKAAEAGAEVREGETADARELDARIVIGADGCNGSVGEAARARRQRRPRCRARGELPVRAALRGRDGARDRGHPRRLRLDLPQGRPRQRRRRRERGGGAEAARRAAPDVRGVRDRPRRGAGNARLPAADAAAAGRGSRAAGRR